MAQNCVAQYYCYTKKPAVKLLITDDILGLHVTQILKCNFKYYLKYAHNQMLYLDCCWYLSACYIWITNNKVRRKQSIVVFIIFQQLRQLLK